MFTRHGDRREPPVRETENYTESHPAQTGNEARIKPWVRNFLQPVVVGVMVMCIAISFVQFVHTFSPEWSGARLIMMPVLSAFLGHYTYRIARKKYLSGVELLQFQVIELLVLFIIVKIAGYMDNTIPEVLADMRTWPDDWGAIFDGQTMITFALSFAAWCATWGTANDLEELADPAMYDTYSFTRPVDRMSQRFLIGGLILLFFAGLARIGLAGLSTDKAPRAPGLVLNALVYFIGGLIILGQLRFARLTRIWRSRKTHFEPTLSANWVRYTLILLGIVVIVAFLLPTGYTIGFLDLVNFILMVMSYLLSFLYFLLVMPIAFLLSLFKQPQMAESLSVTQPEISPSFTPTEHQPILLIEILRSIIFWIIAIGIIYYVVRSYLRDRPELWATFRRFHLIHLLAGWLSSLRRWWRGLRSNLGEQIRRVVEQARSVIHRTREPRAARKNEQSRRGWVFYHYLSTLDHARTAGFPRHQAQTPYEYNQTLKNQIVTAQQDMAHLTQIFVEARYSEHILEEQILKKVELEAQHVQAALRELKKSQEDEE